jgi:type IV pilus assembly protein PilO
MDLNELSFDRLGSWPIGIRIIALIATFVFTLILGYLLLIKPRLTMLHNLEKQQGDLKSRYQTQYQQAAVLPQYEEQLTNMQKTVATLSRQLTTTKEIPQLIDAISKLALANNIEVNLIKQEIVRDSYMTMPIYVVVTGDYHHLASFTGQLSILQKIITFDDFAIATLNCKTKNDSGLALLKMNATATVYMSP